MNWLSWAAAAMAAASGLGAEPPFAPATLVAGSAASGFEVELRADQSVVSRSWEFFLPEGASQGPSDWYLLRLRFRIQLSARGDGDVFVSGSMNGLAGAQLKFSRTPARRGTIEQSSVGLVDGFVEKRTQARTLEVDYRNFVPYRAVRDGMNRVTVRAERFGELRISRLEFLNGTGLFRTDRGPAFLSVRKWEPVGPIVVGERVTMQFEIRNLGDRPARGVLVGVELPGDAPARVDGPAQKEIEGVHSGARGSFSVVARRPGRIPVRLYVLGGAREATLVADIQVPTAPKPPTSGGLIGIEIPWRPVGVALIACGAVLIAVAARRRPRRGSALRDVRSGE